MRHETGDRRQETGGPPRGYVPRLMSHVPRLMPTFHYTAKRGPHDVVEGTVDADNRGGVLTYLADHGYVPVRVVEESVQSPRVGALHPAPAATSRAAVRVPAGHLTAFTRQFASLVRSSVPLLRAMKILEEQAKHPGMRHI